MTDAPHSPAEPTRRDVLAGMAGVAALVLAPAGVAASPGGVSPLLQASSRLTGIALDSSYLELADTVWSTLAPTYGAPVLQKLVQAVNAAPADRPLKDVLSEQGLLPAGQALATTWYTGGSAVDQGKTVLFYDDALMWRACAFTKPPANCGGQFGYWEQAWTPGASGPAPASKT
ncbi:sorbitol dehydrogenase family protein (plasmid) [Skermanella mucosa]|uniref:sugar dehydrogenase complex small subunit n=1 Tax=Skermanella mucosa TaxID=1789672 RepID=UPI00192A9505|nr:sugar dehydrogenase complex small subunit [Skermanella mucosa]UEM24994.1 sorbitol dehydrogenase family protein [Skermanella mucosa]